MSVEVLIPSLETIKPHVAPPTLVNGDGMSYPHPSPAEIGWQLPGKGGGYPNAILNCFFTIVSQRFWDCQGIDLESVRSHFALVRWYFPQMLKHFEQLRYTYLAKLVILVSSRQEPVTTY